MIFSGVQRVIYLVSMWKVSKPQWIRASFQQNVNTDMPRRSLQTTTQTTRGKENSEIRSSAATTIGKKISISFCCSYMCSDWWIRCSDDVADAPVAVCATAGKQARCDPGLMQLLGIFFEGGKKFGWMRVTLCRPVLIMQGRSLRCPGRGGSTRALLAVHQLIVKRTAVAEVRDRRESGGIKTKKENTLVIFSPLF